MHQSVAESGGWRVGRVDEKSAQGPTAVCVPVSERPLALGMSPHGHQIVAGTSSGHVLLLDIDGSTCRSDECAEQEPMAERGLQTRGDSDSVRASGEL